MAGGYSPPQASGMEIIAEELRGIFRRLAELETPTGTSMNSLVAQVQQAIADINTTVAAAVSSTSYTQAQIDSRIAAPANVTSSGQLDSAGAPLKSQPSYNYMVTTAYKGAWIDGVTYQIGYSPSTEAVKTDLEPMSEADVTKLLSLTPYWGRYLWDDPATPPKAFFLAAEVQAAGFGPDIAPVVETEPLEMVGADGQPVCGADGSPIVIPVGEAYTVNYSQMVVPLLAALKLEAARGVVRDERMDEIRARLDAAGL